MYLIGHALKNIVRNKGRYFLTGAILIVSLTAITVSAMIHFTAEAVIDDYSDRFGACLRIVGWEASWSVSHPLPQPPEA